MRRLRGGLHPQIYHDFKRARSPVKLPASEPQFDFARNPFIGNRAIGRLRLGWINLRRWSPPQPLSLTKSQ